MITARLSPGELLKVSEDIRFDISATECKNAIWRRFVQFIATKTEYRSFVCVNRNVPFRLQTGPTCGLVALRICAEVLAPEQDSIGLLQLAISLGLTSQGEFFSAEDLARVAVARYVLRHLRTGLILFPYDAAKNHEPQLKNGASAHWAIAKGFVIDTNGTPASGFSNISEFDECKFLYSDSPNAATDEFLDSIDTPSYERVYLVVTHAKSKQQFLWPMSDIRASNNCLDQYDASKLSTDGITSPGDLSKLRRHVIFLSSGKP